MPCAGKIECYKESYNIQKREFPFGELSFRDSAGARTQERAKTSFFIAKTAFHLSEKHCFYLKIEFLSKS